jgi:hypothetical protein
MQALLIYLAYAVVGGLAIALLGFIGPVVGWVDRRRARRAGHGDW